ncbi:MAG: hypothetical protein ACFFD4_12560 [Candidatus Odinarchaeota archaeon]
MMHELTGPVEQPLRVFLTAVDQEDDLNCCYLAEGKGYHYCQRDLDGEELVSCEDCQSATAFLNRKKKIPVPARVAGNDADLAPITRE